MQAAFGGGAMTAEWAAVIIAIVVASGTCANVFIALSIRNSVLGLKLWCGDKFVSKEEMSVYLSPIKDSIQMIGSGRRLQGLDPEHIPVKHK